jgi:hypothetical protein
MGSVLRLETALMAVVESRLYGWRRLNLMIFGATLTLPRDSCWLCNMHFKMRYHVVQHSARQDLTRLDCGYPRFYLFKVNQWDSWFASKRSRGAFLCSPHSGFSYRFWPEFDPGISPVTVRNTEQPALRCRMEFKVSSNWHMSRQVDLNERICPKTADRTSTLHRP